MEDHILGFRISLKYQKVGDEMRAKRITRLRRAPRTFGLLLAAQAALAAIAAASAAAFDRDYAVDRLREDPEGGGDATSRSSHAINSNEKLQLLIDAGMTSVEIALACGSSVRGIEERRRSLRNGATKMRVAKLDHGLDALFSIFSMLEEHKIEPSNIRAWLVGRSPFLEQQRPAALLGAGEPELYELVRDAATAYASNETPAEFLAERGRLPRIAEPV
jgi:hypothetical protein